jgi:predicted ATPase
MSHPFGDLLSQYLHRKHGLSQFKLAAGVFQAPSIITHMCKGRRLSGSQARERVVLIIDWLCEQGALTTINEANALLDAAGMASLHSVNAAEALLLDSLASAAPAPGRMPVANITPDVVLNLPVPSTPLIGRKGELATLHRHIKNPHCRMLTLAGPGGVGKTRLAIELATECAASFSDGACYIDVQPVLDASGLAFAIADALRMAISGNDSPWRQIRNHLANKKMLLVLDNFEHVIEEGAMRMAEILIAAPKVIIIVTSRQVLNLQQEWRYLVQGIDYPRALDDAIIRYDAVQLFVERAQRIHTGFTFEQNAGAIAHICQMTEGMPLAIEMAATWTKSLSCAEIERELARGIAILNSQMRDAPQRHKSMEAAFAHSWQLLTVHERDVFARLSIFRGGFSRDAAGAVANAILSDLASLVDQSFIQCLPDGRYRIHELMRQFGEERLNQSLENFERASECHAHFYAAFLEAAGTLLFSQQHSFLLQCRPEMDNLRMAWRWMVKRCDIDAIGRTAIPLYWIAQYESNYFEGAAMLQSAVDRLRASPGEREAEYLLVAILPYLAWLELRLGRIDETERSCNDCRALQQRLHSLPLASWGSSALAILSIIATIRGNYGLAEQLALEELAQIERDQYWLNFPVARYAFANAAIAQGRLDPAQRAIGEAIAMCDKLHEQWFKAYCYTTLGNIEHTRSNPKRALAHYQTAYTLREQFNDKEGMAVALTRMGEIALEKGDVAAAKQQFEESLSLYHDLNDRGGLATVHKGLGDVACADSQFAAAAHDYCNALQITCDIHYLALIFSLLLSIANLFLCIDQPATALSIFALVIHHPASDHACRKRAQHELDRLGSVPQPMELNTDWQIVLMAECEMINRQLQATEHSMQR